MSRTLLPLLLIAGMLPATSVRADENDGELRWPAETDVEIDVEFVSGSIDFEGWDLDEVRVRASRRTREALDVEASPDAISIGIPAARFGWLRNGGEVRLRIDVPRGSRIRAKLTNGPLRVEGVNGTLRLQTANGEIDVRGAPREAHLETVASDIDFEGTDSRVDARSISGGIDLKGVGREVIASTTSGSIEVEGGTLGRIDLRTLSGSIELEATLAEDARVALKTFSGSIDVELPVDTSAAFELQSFSGDLRAELGNGRTTSQSGGPGRHLTFDIGEGSGRVSIETFSGSVRLEVSD
jgi:hypothetical protein